MARIHTLHRRVEIADAQILVVIGTAGGAIIMALACWILHHA